MKLGRSLREAMIKTENKRQEVRKGSRTYKKKSQKSKSLPYISKSLSASGAVYSNFMLLAKG